MAYDATELEGALERPTLTVRRPWWQLLLGVHHVLGRTKTYEGRILSHREWIPLQRRWIEISEADPETIFEAGEHDAESEQLIRDTCDAIGIPADVVLSLPGRAMTEALNDFLACQFRANLPSGTMDPKTTPRHSRPATGSRNGSRKKSNAHGMLVP